MPVVELLGRTDLLPEVAGTDRILAQLATLWVGGLLALVVHLRRFPDELRRAVPRFSAAALLCVIAVGLSGIVESVVTLHVWDALSTTERGHLIIAKTLAL